MSNFICPECSKEIIDTPQGYITGCEHYPAKAMELSKSQVKRIRSIMRIDGPVEFPHKLFEAFKA